MASPQYREPYVEERRYNTVHATLPYPVMTSTTTAPHSYQEPTGSLAPSSVSQQAMYPPMPMSTPNTQYAMYPPMPMPVQSHYYPHAQQQQQQQQQQPRFPQPAFSTGPHYPPVPAFQHDYDQKNAPPYSPPGYVQPPPPSLPPSSIQYSVPPLSPRMQYSPNIPMATSMATPQPQPPTPPPSFSSLNRTSHLGSAVPHDVHARLEPLLNPVHRALPILPKLSSPRPTPYESSKCCVLKPLPYGWSPSCPEGQPDPMEMTSIINTNGYQNVTWDNAFRDLSCDGGCKNPRAFTSRIRYTCSNCPNTAFDLCEGCFHRLGPEGISQIHNPSHEIYKMDLSFPDWSHRAWNAGMEGISKTLVRQIGNKTGAWAKGDSKRSEVYLLKKGFPEEETKRPETIEMDGMNLSPVGLMTLLMMTEPNVRELTIRSGPELGGMELAGVFVAFMQKLPNSFPKLQTIRAIGCNFFDFRTNEPSKKVNYATAISNIFAKQRAAQQKLFEAWMAERTESFAGGNNNSGRGFFRGVFGSSSSSSSSSKKKTHSRQEPFVRPAVKVEFSICDNRMSGPCGFPGLKAAFWTGHEPVVCFNISRDATLRIIGYLGDPQRSLDPESERIRVLNKCKAKSHERFVDMLGGPGVITPEINVLLNVVLDRSYSRED
ncbi:hypothetical protein BG004_008381 [Podila humilis]|nr:hypothetical protein BG004_008381 [Podila humilis]